MRPTDAALRWTVVALSVGLLVVCWPLWPALLLAAWTATLARPLLERFERGLKGRRRAAAALALLLFLVLAVPLGLITLGILSGAQDLLAAIRESPSTESALATITSGGTEAPTVAIPRDLAGALELAQRYGSQGLSLLTNVAGAAAKGLVWLLIYFGGAFVFLLDGPAAWAWCRRHSPLRPEHLDRLTAAFHETGRGLLVGVGLTSATQGLMATVVYLSLGIPRWWVLGPITGLATIIPVAGSALVWGPIALGLFLTGNPIKGVVLLALGLGLISTVDNVLRPVFAKMGALKLPVFLMFVALFGGIAAVGPWGALLGPLVVRLWIEAVELRRESAETPRTA
ncbi:MAG: AI-2E family transporter [Myxococcaceae bacterium]|nr:AI-2E family transporter [Myxococcaceae bacterium]